GERYACCQVAGHMVAVVVDGAKRSGSVSVINKMLQELDRRNATAGTEAEQPPQQVKATRAPHRAQGEWFWRIVAVRMLGAVAWVGWVAYQLRPRAPVATELAFKAAEQLRKGVITPAVPAAPEAKAEAATEAPPQPPTPAAPVPDAPS